MSRFFFAASLFLLVVLFGCVWPPIGDPFSSDVNGLSDEQLGTLNALKDPRLVEQRTLSKSDLDLEFDSDDELYAVLGFAKEKGFGTFLGAVKSSFSDGNNVTMVLLANARGKALFAQRIEFETFSKSLLLYFEDEQHYTFFDSNAGIARNGEEFRLLGFSDVQQISFAGETAVVPVNVLGPDVLSFGFCEEKGGGFWRCIMDHKGDLGWSIIAAVGTCTVTVLEVPLTAITAGALSPLQIASLLGCIGSTGSAGYIVYECAEKLMDNAPRMDSYSQLGGECFACSEGKRWKMTLVTMKAVVEDDRLPDPDWLTPNEVTECGSGTASYVFEVQDCGKNRASKEETAELPVPILSLQQCVNSDECCPAGCTSKNDSDCGVVCGDGVAEGTEDCDLIDFKGKTCETLGFAPGALRCQECTFFTSGCGNCRTDNECGDSNACTQDACVDFTCKHASIANCCQNTADCNDDDICTSDACNSSNRCQSTPITYAPTGNTPQQGNACSQCDSLGLGCAQDLLVPGSNACCPLGYCLADGYCHSSCTVVNSKTCKNGLWE